MTTLVFRTASCHHCRRLALKARLYLNPFDIKVIRTTSHLHRHSAAYKSDVSIREDFPLMLRNQTNISCAQVNYLSKAGNSQNAEGVCSLDGLTVPDEEASISRCFGEKVLGFGAGDVSVTPWLGSGHCAAGGWQLLR